MTTNPDIEKSHSGTYVSSQVTLGTSILIDNSRPKKWLNFTFTRKKVRNFMRVIRNKFKINVRIELLQTGRKPLDENLIIMSQVR